MQGKLDASYEASKHPVDYFTGQTGFNGLKIKEYYATMLEHGTLDVYWTTQIIDFGFILAVACMGLFFCTLVSRAGRPKSWSRTFGHFAALSAISGATSDALENLVSFVMLSAPQDFPNWLAIPYSGFAVIKFGLITLAMGLLIFCILAAIIGRVAKNPRIG